MDLRGILFADFIRNIHNMHASADYTFTIIRTVVYSVVSNKMMESRCDDLSFYLSTVKDFFQFNYFVSSALFLKFREFV